MLKYFLVTVSLSIFCYIYLVNLNGNSFFESFHKYLNFLHSESNSNYHDINLDHLFSEKELSDFKGENGETIYLSILGNVFDVTKGNKFYGKSGSYNGFAGRDASRAFITGDFSHTGLTSDLSNLKSQDILTLESWLERYHKDYTYKGKLIGYFYDSQGSPTKQLLDYQERLKKAKVEKESEEMKKVSYPPCNVQWSQDEGSTVWCTKQSGGISRSWAGVPRKLFEPGKNEHRCACVNPDSNDITLKNIQLYKGCLPDSSSCRILE